MKLVKLIMLISLCAIMAACSTKIDSTVKNTDFISEAKLSEREKTFLSLGNNAYFVFDFSASDKYKWIKVWIDRYEFGNKLPDGGSLMTGLSQSSEGMLIATLREHENMKSDWTIAIHSGGATATGVFKHEYENEEKSSFAKTWQTAQSKDIAIDGNEIILASICYKEQKNGTSMSSLSDEFFKNSDENIKEISEYNLVYLLKVKFYESDPNK